MARDKALADKKNAFKVEHLGELLARHERFCLSRAGNQRVSPSVRWGLWWDILTGHRRGSGTRLAYEDVEFKDPRGDAGWGLATWQPDVMKTQNPFTLPIPPLGLHIIRCCLRDWTQAAERAGIWNRKSRWVFASRVLQSEKGDIAVGGSAFATHIYNMRGLRQDNHRDVLSGIPDFSMHVIRSTLGDFILEHTDLPPGTASLMISHEIAGDRKSDLDRVGQTGKRWYFQAQRIPEKTKAMELWSKALLDAFKKATSPDGRLEPARQIEVMERYRVPFPSYRSKMLPRSSLRSLSSGISSTHLRSSAGSFRARFKKVSER